MQNPLKWWCTRKFHLCTHLLPQLWDVGMDRLLLLGLQMEKLESLTLYPDHSHTAGNHSFLDWIITEACVVWPDSGTFLEPSGGGSHLLNYRKCCKSWACEVLDATPHQPDGDILTAGMQEILNSVCTLCSGWPSGHGTTCQCGYPYHCQFGGMGAGKNKVHTEESAGHR